MLKVKTIHMEKSRLGLIDKKINEMMEGLNGEIKDLKIIESISTVTAFCVYEEEVTKKEALTKAKEVGKSRSNGVKAPKAKAARKGSPS